MAEVGLPLVSRVRGDKVEHRWKMRMHLDGCHWYSSVFACVDCSATIGTYDERDLAFDPWSAVWMEPSGDPDEKPCERCRELQDGAEPAHNVEFAAA